jgi:cytochrome c-type biogenesis protein CcmH
LLTIAAVFWLLRAYHSGGVKPREALAVSAAIGVLALVAYLFTGSPELPGASYETRLAALKQRPPTTYTYDEAIALIAEGAREHPDDPMPHLYTGQLLLQQGRAQEAARAFDSALRREPRLAAALMGMGESLAYIDGRISPEALAFFEQAGPLSNDPAPWVWQATAAMESGRDADARRFWGEALVRMGPDDPRREMARRFSTGAGQ